MLLESIPAHLRAEYTDALRGIAACRSIITQRRAELNDALEARSEWQAALADVKHRAAETRAGQPRWRRERDYKAARRRDKKMLKRTPEELKAHANDFTRPANHPALTKALATLARYDELPEGPEKDAAEAAYTAANAEWMAVPASELPPEE